MTPHCGPGCPTTPPPAPPPGSCSPVGTSLSRVSRTPSTSPIDPQPSLSRGDRPDCRRLAGQAPGVAGGGAVGRRQFGGVRGTPCRTVVGVRPVPPGPAEHRADPRATGRPGPRGVGGPRPVCSDCSARSADPAYLAARQPLPRPPLGLARTLQCDPRRHHHRPAGRGTAPGARRRAEPRRHGVRRPGPAGRRPRRAPGSSRGRSGNAAPAEHSSHGGEPGRPARRRRPGVRPRRPGTGRAGGPAILHLSLRCGGYPRLPAAAPAHRGVPRSSADTRTSTATSPTGRTASTARSGASPTPWASSAPTVCAGGRRPYG